MSYRAGDFWRTCDRCGFKVRSSETRKQWDGLIVCRDDFEERHPQDFVRGRPDHQSVPEPRPPVTIFLPGDAYIRIEGGRFLAEQSGYFRVFELPDAVTVE